ncbi:unnamed protein product [Effrenium voratum]|nr:unnamed protein product [Effrenium voratum]
MTGAEPTDQVDEAWTEEVSSPEQTAESVGKDGALRQELEQRQAIIRRQQGETFLLATQVKQLEQQVTEASRDAQACSAQLAQVLQLMDSTGGRVPLKGEVDRARALVTAARRAIRRVACWSEGEPPHSSRGERSSAPSSASPVSMHNQNGPFFEGFFFWGGWVGGGEPQGQPQVWGVPHKQRQGHRM